VLHQFFGNLPGKSAVRSFRAVPRIAENTYFVFDLCHQNGMVMGVEFAHMARQGTESAPIGLPAVFR
jgi:AraC-like DNA-binding protein